MTNNVKRVTLVTGGSRGIGAFIVEKFSKEGDIVIINYKNNHELAKKTLDRINGLGKIIQTDVSDYNQVNTMIKTILDEYGRIDVLVNNAGIFSDSLLRNMDETTWRNVIDVNLNGVFNCTRAVINPMREQKKGRIINVVSVQAQTGTIGASNYCASKAGVIGFTKAIAREVARYNITVNAVAFGFINEGMLKRLSEEIQKNILQQIPMRRFGEPDEAAKFIYFLASDDTSYITGQVINLDGGYHM